MKSLDAYWYSNNVVAWLLLPLSWLYCLITGLRRYCYKIGLLKSHKLKVPILVVGNISVGGTGKAPLLIAICKLLKDQGIKTGIVSRGYGGSFTGEKLVSRDDTAETAGDEPFMLAQQTHCPVAVGINRVAAAQLLINHHSCDIILSDDGLQHYRMKRDFEIAVIDTNREFGNGFCIPAGPLREPRSRLSTTDMVIYHGKSSEDYRFTLEFMDAINLATKESRTIESFSGETVHAVAGIGHPKRFFSQLKKAGLTVIEHAFPDHYSYEESDISYDDNYSVVMTEKDAVKCAGFSFKNCWTIPVEAKLSDALAKDMLEEVRALINA